ncbi:PTS fructose transporter subunit EIIBC [Lonepinella koalarum]|uniref:fructose-specific PTS transporter subunit EIIC n=1 Tax=Lonepinella koalarum TaxID=53417 RepID=UPI0011E45E73|nr:fructose-specific PTS transporter subunit EIIC [Lonepinella koalarum]TYG34426.1 PTS fructose transporter subunit EIIBC [Lonepinella koalarum]
MRIFITFSDNVGQAKTFLIRQRLTQVAQTKSVELVELAEQADVALVVGKTLPNLTALSGKKVALVDLETAFQSPESALEQVQNNAVDYVAPVQPAVQYGAISGRNIVAVTACPTGVAHTFMSAEAIEAYGKKMGWNVRVETRGQVGAGNPITDEEVAQADLVFVAADIDVNLDKFQGKPMYRTSTGLALKKTAQEFDKAFVEAKVYQPNNSSEKSETSKTERKGIYKHLMTGVSHMLPIVVAGGLLIAIAFALGGIYVGNEENAGTFGHDMMTLGGAAFGLMIAVFAGYVAYSIADRPGLAVGLVGGSLAASAGAGILGGIIAGFLAGYVVKGLNQFIKLPASMSALKPILILPLFGTAIVGWLLIHYLNPPVAFAMKWLESWLAGLGSTNAILFGALLGGMMCIDMGGPVNKAAYVFGTGLITSGITTPMAAVMAAGMVPPIGMAIATWIARNKFDEAQRNAGNAGFVLGLCFISEGALPFVAADPLRVILSSVIGGATAGAISMSLGISLPAPHGGVFVVPLVSQPLMYIGAIAVGSVVTGLLYSVIKPKLVK